MNNLELKFKSKSLANQIKLENLKIHDFLKKLLENKDDIENYFENYFIQDEIINTKLLTIQETNLDYLLEYFNLNKELKDAYISFYSLININKAKLKNKSKFENIFNEILEEFKSNLKNYNKEISNFEDIYLEIKIFHDNQSDDFEDSFEEENDNIINLEEKKEKFKNYFENNNLEIINQKMIEIYYNLNKNIKDLENFQKILKIFIFLFFIFNK